MPNAAWCQILGNCTATDRNLPCFPAMLATMANMHPELTIFILHMLSESHLTHKIFIISYGFGRLLFLLFLHTVLKHLLLLQSILSITRSCAFRYKTLKAPSLHWLSIGTPHLPKIFEIFSGFTIIQSFRCLLFRGYLQVSQRFFGLKERLNQRSATRFFSSLAVPLQ